MKRQSETMANLDSFDNEFKPMKQIVLKQIKSNQKKLSIYNPKMSKTFYKPAHSQHRQTSTLNQDQASGIQINMFSPDILTYM